MEAGALAPYDRALRSGGPLRLRASDGEVIALDVARWLGDVDAADESVLRRCRGPVLDVGCGPGRFVTALTERGVPALGVDIAEAAVALTRSGGRPALRRDVFAALPGEGRWPTVLVMDGNVGIGGEPVRLLSRLGCLLAAGGRAIVEASPDASHDDRLVVRFAEGDGVVGPEFPWARVGVGALASAALSVGLRVVDSWVASGRPFVVLSR